jgi:hypothetical protein
VTPTCSFGLSATSQQYFSLRTNQPTAISQQYFSLTANQHQPSATSQTNRLAGNHVLVAGVADLAFTRRSHWSNPPPPQPPAPIQTQHHRPLPKSIVGQTGRPARPGPGPNWPGLNWPGLHWPDLIDGPGRASPRAYLKAQARPPCIIYGPGRANSPSG